LNRKERNGRKNHDFEAIQKVQVEMSWNYCGKEAICLAVPTPYATKAYTRLLIRDSTAGGCYSPLI
jgi:hypothetical protein